MKRLIFLLGLSIFLVSCVKKHEVSTTEVIEQENSSFSDQERTSVTVILIEEQKDSTQR